jgi:hypothetical protein
MKKKKILLVLIKEADGSFSALGHPERDRQELVSAQADSWEELKEKALLAVNAYRNSKGQEPVTHAELEFSFDLPSFFDAYPTISAAALAPQGTSGKGADRKAQSGRKKTTGRQLHRILEAVKELDSEPSKRSA